MAVRIPALTEIMTTVSVSVNEKRDFQQIQNRLTYSFSTVNVLRSYEKHYVEDRR